MGSLMTEKPCVQPSGFDTNRFTLPVDDNFICSVCYGVFRNPVLLDCDHSFCKVCISNWAAKSKDCPQCRKTFSKDNFRPYFRPMQAMLQRLEIKCENENFGCPITTVLEDIEKHQAKCSFKQVLCPLNGCGKKVVEKDLKNHSIEHSIEALETRTKLLEKENTQLKTQLSSKNEFENRLKALETGLSSLKHSVESMERSKTIEKKSLRDLLIQMSNSLLIPSSEPKPKHTCESNNSSSCDAQAVVEVEADEKIQKKFFRAVEAGRVEDVEHLLKSYKIDVNQSKAHWRRVSTSSSSRFTSDGTALLWASQEGCLSICRLLVKHGADVNLKNNEEETPLLKAVANGHSNVAEYLLKRGANVNAMTSYHDTPLILACEDGNLGLCQLLVRHGAEVEAKNNAGDTALLFSASKGHVEIYQFLLAHGANPKTTNKKGKSAKDIIKEIM